MWLSNRTESGTDHVFFAGRRAGNRGLSLFCGFSRTLIGAGLMLCATLVQAQDWPTKPVKFVSPYPPGGSVDPLARLFAVKLGESLKQNFLVENRTGASGVIGT